jgi:uncharacterized membrane protein
MLKVEVIVVKNFMNTGLPELYMNISHIKKFGEHLHYIVFIFSLWALAGLCVKLFQHLAYVVVAIYMVEEAEREIYLRYRYFGWW